MSYTDELADEVKAALLRERAFHTVDTMAEFQRARRALHDHLADIEREANAEPDKGAVAECRREHEAGQARLERAVALGRAEGKVSRAALDFAEAHRVRTSTEALRQRYGSSDVAAAFTSGGDLLVTADGNFSSYTAACILAENRPYDRPGVAAAERAERGSRQADDLLAALREKWRFDHGDR